MTELQIQFYEAQEAKRHNIAQEALTRWYNQATAATNQMNAETNRLNFGVNAANAETNRHNMLINSRNADTNAANAQTNYNNMLVNRQNAQINQQNADTNAFNAATNRLNYTVNLANAQTNMFNALINKQNADTQANRLELDRLNSETQRELWSADAAFKRGTLQPTIDKYASEAYKNYYGSGGAGGGNSNGSGFQSIIANSFIKQDMNHFRQMAEGSRSWFNSDKSSEWFGSMLSSPVYTTASFGVLAGKAAKQKWKDIENHPITKLEYPLYYNSNLNDMYGYMH